MFKSLNNLKLSLIPLLSMASYIVFIFTKIEVFLDLSRILILIFSFLFLSILSFLIIKQGISGVVELEMELLPWFLFFLMIIIHSWQLNLVLF